MPDERDRSLGRCSAPSGCPGHRGRRQGVRVFRCRRVSERCCSLASLPRRRACSGPACSCGRRAPVWSQRLSAEAAWSERRFRGGGVGGAGLAGAVPRERLGANEHRRGQGCHRPAQLTSLTDRGTHRGEEEEETQGPRLTDKETRTDLAETPESWAAKRLGHMVQPGTGTCLRSSRPSLSQPSLVGPGPHWLLGLRQGVWPGGEAPGHSQASWDW